MSAAAPLAPDAAMALGLASTALPFARTPAEEAERWLRVLRMHGEAGAVLQALGVSEGPLHALGGHSAQAAAPLAGGDSERAVDAAPAAAEGDAVAQVAERAAGIAEGRGAGAVATTDVLRAVMCIYDEDFDRVLRAHGTDREEVQGRLRERAPAGALDDPRR